jgi:hypothetical protein
MSQPHQIHLPKLQLAVFPIVFIHQEKIRLLAPASDFALSLLAFSSRAGWQTKHSGQ